jgi:hypothetical protein
MLQSFGATNEQYTIKLLQDDEEDKDSFPMGVFHLKAEFELAIKE